MPAVVLHFSTEDDTRLQACVAALAAAGLRCASRPHCTLVSGQAVDAAAPTAVQAALPLHLPVAGWAFLEAGDLLLQLLLAPTLELLRLQATAVAGCTGPRSFYRPGAWVPHILLARGLRAADVAAARAALQRQPPPACLRAESVLTG